VLREVRRLLRPGGRLVLLDILTSADPAVAARHNEIERARDPSHTAFRPGDELRDRIEAAGLAITEDARWSRQRSFDEWAAIIDEPERMADVERRMRALVREGDPLGIDLREEDGALCFDYRWGLFAADVA
jgi:SAM-dependent methyltransferase